MPYRLCRHVKSNGIQCHAPAMHAHDFCYFHKNLRFRNRHSRPNQHGEVMQPVYDPQGRFLSMEPTAAAPESARIDLGLLEDAPSIQVALSTLVNALATNRIDLRRATALLYGLQLASSNCRALERSPETCPEDLLREIATDEAGEPIALSGLHQGETDGLDAAALRKSSKPQPNQVFANKLNRMNHLRLQSNRNPNRMKNLQRNKYT